MNREELLKELARLEQQSKDQVEQMNQHQQRAQDLKDEALITKGEHKALTTVLENLKEKESHASDKPK